MQLHTTKTFASFGSVSLIVKEGSRGIIWLEETTRVIVVISQEYFKSASPKIK